MHCNTESIHDAYLPSHPSDTSATSNSMGTDLFLFNYLTGVSHYTHEYFTKSQYGDSQCYCGRGVSQQSAGLSQTLPYTTREEDTMSWTVTLLVRNSWIIMLFVRAKQLSARVPLTLVNLSFCIHDYFFQMSEFGCRFLMLPS